MLLTLFLYNNNITYFQRGGKGQKAWAHSPNGIIDAQGHTALYRLSVDGHIYT